jgi:beta-1,4-mannosyltransferase
MRGTGRPSRTPACTFNSVSVGAKQRNVRNCSVKAAAAEMRCSSLRVLSLPGREFGGNPYIKLFCDSLERAGIAVANIHTTQGKYLKFDVLHIHWPEFYITEKSIYTAIALAPTVLFYMVATKLLRKKIVWTVHDVTPMRPRHARLLQLYLLCVRVLVDAYVFMSRSSEAEFVKIFPRTRKKKVCHVPHGPYPVSATSQQRQAELRERLSGGGDCLLVGFFGDIRPYKNAEVLAYLPDQDAIGREIKIVVAGAADPTYNTTEIEAPLSRILPKRMVRIKERISDQDLVDMIRAVDFVLLPYLRGSNSGFSMLVLSCGQRLLCSALPMFRELQNRLGPPWVHIFDHHAKNLSAELEAALSRVQHDVMDPEATSRLAAFFDECSFDHGAQRLYQLYDDL